MVYVRYLYKLKNGNYNDAKKNLLLMQKRLSGEFMIKLFY